MEERPPDLTRRGGGDEGGREVRRYRRSSPATRGLAALGGVLLGIGFLAAIAWAVVSQTRNDPTAADVATGGVSTGPPPKPVLKIVFPEGFTRKDMAGRITAVNEIAEDKRSITPRLSQTTYMRAADSKLAPPGFPKKRVSHLEGFLFPATYEFTEDTTSKELVDDQLDAFMRAWGELDLDFARTKKLTAYDVLIIASMVEKEVQVPKERPLVAAVIYNRLKAGFPLGIDATIRYGLDIPPTQAIRQSQLDSDSPYNTRKFQGLTPTPIANPGLASLQAAAHPANVDFLYFVRKADCKSHFFTESEQEFEDYPRAGLNC